MRKFRTVLVLLMIASLFAGVSDADARRRRKKPDLTIGSTIHMSFAPRNYGRNGKVMEFNRGLVFGTPTPYFYVDNKAPKAARSSFARLFLSTDPYKSANDVPVGTDAAVPAIGRYRYSDYLAFPPVTTPDVATLPKGVYRVLVCADATNLIREKRESNNCKAGPEPVDIDPNFAMIGTTVNVPGTLHIQLNDLPNLATIDVSDVTIAPAGVTVTHASGQLGIANLFLTLSGATQGTEYTITLANVSTMGGDPIDSARTLKFTAP